MKRPRFTLRALLVLPVLVACAAFWYSWPDRTFASFEVAILAEDYETVNSLIDHLHFEFRNNQVHVANGWSRSDYFSKGLVRDKPSFADVLLARRSYKRLMKDPSIFPGKKSPKFDLLYEFVVERGSITLVVPPQKYWE